MAVQQAIKDGKDITVQHILNQNHFFHQWLILSIALIAIGSIIGLNIFLEYERTQNREQERLLAQTKVLQENIGQNLIASRDVLVGLRQHLPKGRADKDLITRLQALTDAIPGVRTIALIDASGTIRVSNRLELIGKNFSQRDYFKVPKQQPDQNVLYITPPFISSLGTFTLSASVIIPGPKGEFAGVVTAQMDPKYFAPIMDSVLYAPDMWVGIAHWEGSIFMMRPEMKEFTGGKFSPGSFFFQHKNSGKEFTVHRGTANITGDDRLLVVRTVRPAGLNIPTPLTVAASRNPRAIFASWRKDSLKFIALYGMIVFISILGLYAFHRRQRQFSKQAAEAANALKQSEERFRSFVENANDIIYSLNHNGVFTYASPNWTEILGHNVSEVIGHNFEIFVHPDDLASCRAFLERTIVSGEKQAGIEYRVLHKNGTWRWHTSNAAIINNTNKNTDSYIGIARDVTDKKEAEARLLESRKELGHALTELELILKNASLGILTVVPAPNGQRVMRRANIALERLLGYEHGELEGLNTRVLYPSDEGYNAINAAYAQVVCAGGTYRGEHKLIRKDGQTIFGALSGSAIDPDNPLNGAIWMVENITERKHNQDQINQLAYYDVLTNLPNRRLMQERLNLGLTQAKRFHRSLAIMFMDIDFFKEINDTLGHDVGDELLKVVAARLVSCVRGGDTVSRQGGDEFIIVLHEITQPEDAALVAEKIITIVREPVIIQENELHVTMSIGIAVYPVDGIDDPRGLMKKADIAMYEAKNAGRNGFRFYR